MIEQGYIEWLENMVVLLAKCYQETHDMLLEKAKSGNKAYFEMPTVQGTPMVMAVYRISKFNLYSTISSEKIGEYTAKLEESQSQGEKKES